MNEVASFVRQGLKDFLDYDLSQHSYTLGPKLAFDAEKQRFADNEDANKMLTRAYREPFVVTEEV